MNLQEIFWTCTYTTDNTLTEASYSKMSVELFWRTMRVQTVDHEIELPSVKLSIIIHTQILYSIHTQVYTVDNWMSWMCGCGAFPP